MMASKKHKADVVDKEDKSGGRKQLARRLEVLSALAENLEERTSGFHQRVDQLEESLSAVNQTGSRLNGRVDDLAGRGQQLDEALEQVRSQSMALSERIEALASSGSNERELNALRQRFGELAQHDAQLRESVEVLKADVGRLGAQLNDSDQRTGEMLTELDKLAQDNQVLAQLEQDLGAMQERIPDLSGLQSRLEQLEHEAAPVAAEQASHRDQLQRLDKDLEGLRQDQTGMEQRLEQTLGSLAELQQRADVLGEQMGGLEQTARQLTELEQGDEDLRRGQEDQRLGLDELRNRLGTLGEGVHEATDLIGQEAQRLSFLQEKFDSDSRELQAMASHQARQRDELEALIARLEELEQGRERDGEASRTDLEALQAKLNAFESGLHALGQQTDHRLQQTAGEVQALQERTDSVTGRLDALSEMPGRLSELENLTSPMSGRLDSQDDTLAQLRQQLDGLEQAAEELSGRVADEAGRIALQAEKSETDQERLTELAEEVNQNGLDLASVIARLEGLQESDGQLERSLEETRERAGRLAEQDHYLERALEAAQEKFADLGNALDNTGSSISEVQKSHQGLDDRITDVRSSLRVLGWSGVAVAVLLLTLSVGGYLFSEEQRRAERDVLDKRLAKLDRSLSEMPLAAAEKAPDVSPQLDDLHQRMENLDRRFADLSVAVAEQPDVESRDRMERNQVNMLSAMDALSERIGELEDVAGAQKQAEAEKAQADAVAETPASATKQEAPSLAPAADQEGPLPVKDAKEEADPAETKPDAPTAKQVEPASSEPAPKPAPEAEPIKPAPEKTQAEKPAAPQDPWRAARKSGAYTVQILGVGKPDSIPSYVRKKGLGGELAGFETRRKGKPWFVLFKGIHATRAQARQAAAAFGKSAWARQIPKTGALKPIKP